MKIDLIEHILYVFLKCLKRIDRRDTDIFFFEPEAVRNILVISSTAIGDTILSTPAIKAIRDRYPKAKIIALFNRKNMELFENNPHIDKIVPYYGGYKKFIKTIIRLRKYKVDTAVILHGNEPQATPIAYLSGAKFILKVPISKKYAFLLSNKDNGFRNPWEHHAIDVRLKTVSFIDCKPKDKRLVLSVENDEIDFINSSLNKLNIKKNHIVVGFQPGAATKHKMWPKRNFIELGKKLIATNEHLRIIITGSKSEKKLCEDIAKQIGKFAYSFAGKLSLKYLPALIKRMNLLVTNDTGTMHIAIALQTKTVSLFCPTNYWGVGPIQDLHLHKIIYKEKTCNPCISKKCKTPFCMNQITVNEVYNAVMEILNENSLL